MIDLEWAPPRSTTTGILVLAVAMSAGGCQQIGAYKGYAATPIDVSKQDTSYDRLDKAIKARTPDLKPCFAEAYRGGGADADLCFGQRNQVISYLMAESIELCTKHVSEIYGNEAGFNIATGTIAALTSTAASISTGTRAATLSAISAFSSAERALVNESVYRNLLTTAIATKIEQSRATLGKALLAKKSQAYAGYRIEDAIYDVIDYHHACSFYKGMELALAEGTNTNPASKLRALETQSQALAQEIDTRAIALRMDDSSRKALIDAKGVASSGDPVLKGLIERYQNIQREILTLTQSPASATAPKVSSGAGGGTLVADLDTGEVVNPLASLIAAMAKVKQRAGAVVDSVKKQAEQDKTVVQDAFMKAITGAATAFAADFPAKLLADKQIGHPLNGAIADAQRVYREAKNTHDVEMSKVDPKSLAGKLKAVEVAVPVKKAALTLEDLERKVGQCEKAAADRIDRFAAQQVDAIKGKSAAEVAKITTIQGAAPDWATDKIGDCVK